MTNSVKVFIKLQIFCGISFSLSAVEGYGGILSMNMAVDG